MKYSTEQHIKWREAVLERDEYKCKLCGNERCDLQVHRMHGVETINVEDGLTVCPPCHRILNKQLRNMRRNSK